MGEVVTGYRGKKGERGGTGEMEEETYLPQARRRQGKGRNGNTGRKGQGKRGKGVGAKGETGTTRKKEEKGEKGDEEKRKPMYTTTMTKIKVAINGLGRIGRAFLRLALAREKGERGKTGIEVVAVNDVAEIETMAYLLKYDSVYGTRGEKGERGIKGRNTELEINGTRIKYLSEKDPARLPWKELDIDVVVEATGFFNTVEGAEKHLEAGARRVVVTAPLKEQSQTNADLTQTNAEKESRSDLGERGEKGETGGRGERGETVLMGLNEEKLKDCRISSNGSCTTNAAAPIIAILDEAIGIEKALLNTVHAYTATQSLVDSPAGKKGAREGRAAAANIVPSSTGAAIAFTKAYPSLEGKFDGISLRVPVICGSIADITFIAKRDTSREEVNEILRKAAKERRWQGIFSTSDDELVSSDIIGSTEGAIAELSMTRVVGLPAAGAAQAGGNLVKVLAWYDNELGYASTLVKHVLAVGKYL